MAHDVIFSLPNRSLGRADIVSQVKRDGEMHGTLAGSKGPVVWFPSGTAYGYKIGWKRFTDLMALHASRFEKR